MIMWCEVLGALLCIISGAWSEQNGGTYTCSPNPWTYNEKFTITFRIDRSVFPSACTGGTTELPSFRMSSNGEDFVSNCSMTDRIGDAGACGSFTSNDIGCGCVSSDDNGFYVIKYNFMASPDYDTTWDATINCVTLPLYIQELNFTGINCTNITTVSTSTIATTTASNNTKNKKTSDDDNAGAIAGGVVGGCAGVCAIVVAVVVYKKKKNNNASCPQNKKGDHGTGTASSDSTTEDGTKPRPTQANLENGNESRPLPKNTRLDPIESELNPNLESATLSPRQKVPPITVGKKM